MNRNFFIRLTFAAHRVADILPEQEAAQEIRDISNHVLTNLLFLVDKEALRPEKREDLLSQLSSQIESLLTAISKAKKQSGVKEQNFALLEVEYGKIGAFLEAFTGLGQEVVYKEIVADVKKEEPQKVSVRPVKVKDHTLGSVKEGNEAKELSDRQKKIIEFLKVKANAQVWELQKILPEVTKRTLRRDLDELLQRDLVERKGAWNSVSYELK